MYLNTHYSMLHILFFLYYLILCYSLLPSLLKNPVLLDSLLFDIKNNKEIFRFEKDKYTSAYKTVPALKLTTGYFDYKGQQIAKIEE